MTDDDQPTAGAPEADSPQSSKPVDFEARFKDGQKYNTKLAMENADLRRRLEALEAGYEADEEDDGDGDGEPTAPSPPISSRFRSAETARPQVPGAERAIAETTELGRSVAEAVHGADVVADYDRAMRLLRNATTEADRVTAFEAYADLRARAASSARRAEPPAGGPRTRDQAVTPVVQTNRPDTVYFDETDPGRYAGGQNDGVRGYVKALLGRGGSR